MNLNGVEIFIKQFLKSYPSVIRLKKNYSHKSVIKVNQH